MGGAGGSEEVELGDAYSKRGLTTTGRLGDTLQTEAETLP